MVNTASEIRSTRFVSKVESDTVFRNQPMEKPALSTSCQMRDPNFGARSKDSEKTVFEDCKSHSATLGKAGCTQNLTVARRRAAFYYSGYADAGDQSRHLVR